mmetsp:Transcript_3946/g.12557  ORF Transcript_3946/g.12557 Transcript_3946/m.12557 type:complete len:362 (+) Transcript_3946:151-1236(+)
MSPLRSPSPSHRSPLSRVSCLISGWALSPSGCSGCRLRLPRSSRATFRRWCSLGSLSSRTRLCPSSRVCRRQTQARLLAYPLNANFGYSTTSSSFLPRALSAPSLRRPIKSSTEEHVSFSRSLAALSRSKGPFGSTTSFKCALRPHRLAPPCSAADLSLAFDSLAGQTCLSPLSAELLTYPTLHTPPAGHALPHPSHGHAHAFACGLLYLLRRHLWVLLQLHVRHEWLVHTIHRQGLPKVALLQILRPFVNRHLCHLPILLHPAAHPHDHVAVDHLHLTCLGAQSQARPFPPPGGWVRPWWSLLAPGYAAAELLRPPCTIGPRCCPCHEPVVRQRDALAPAHVVHLVPLWTNDCLLLFTKP